MSGVAFGVAVNLNFFLNNGAIFLQSAKTLRDCAAIFLVTSIASIEDTNLATFDETATAMATVLVVLVARPEGKFRHGVVDKIFCGGVHPRFILVPLLINRRGVPLAEDVIRAVAAAQAVRVANQRIRSVDVENVMPTTAFKHCLASASVDFCLVKSLLDFFQVFARLLRHKNSS